MYLLIQLQKSRVSTRAIVNVIIYTCAFFWHSVQQPTGFSWRVSCPRREKVRVSTHTTFIHTHRSDRYYKQKNCPWKHWEFLTLSAQRNTETIITLFVSKIKKPEFWSIKAASGERLVYWLLKMLLLSHVTPLA